MAPRSPLRCTCGSASAAGTSLLRLLAPRHARQHAGEDDHPLITSAEPGETWAYCFVDGITVEEPDDVPRAGALPPA